MRTWLDIEIAQKIKYSNRVLEHSLREFEHSLGQA